MTDEIREMMIEQIITIEKTASALRKIIEAQDEAIKGASNEKP